MASRALIGTPLGVTAAAHSGSTRSKAPAKMTRVLDRKTVPHHPQNHRHSESTSHNCRTGFVVRKAASRPGYGPTGRAALELQKAKLAAFLTTNPVLQLSLVLCLCPWFWESWSAH